VVPIAHVPHVPLVAGTHRAPEHCSPAAHRIPQPPQFDGLLDGSTHAPAQTMSLAQQPQSSGQLEQVSRVWHRPSPQRAGGVVVDPESVGSDPSIVPSRPASPEGGVTCAVKHSPPRPHVKRRSRHQRSCVQRTAGIDGEQPTVSRAQSALRNIG